MTKPSILCFHSWELDSIAKGIKIYRCRDCGEIKVVKLEEASNWEGDFE